jgi:hypothetical protein
LDSQRTGKFSAVADPIGIFSDQALEQKTRSGRPSDCLCRVCDTFVCSKNRRMPMADPSVLAKITAQEPSTSPGLQEIRSGESILDSLKLILAGAPLGEVLTTIARLIEGQTPGTLCSIFLLEEEGLHLRYAAAPNLPEAYRAATDGMVIGPNVGSCGRAAFLRQPVFASDILSDPN